MRSREPERSERATHRAESRARRCALGGIALVLAAFTFGAAPLLVGGVGFVLLGLLTSRPGWCSARAARTCSRRVSERRGGRGRAAGGDDRGRARDGSDSPERRSSIRSPARGVPLSEAAVGDLGLAQARAARRHAARTAAGASAFAPPSLLLSDPLGLVLAQQGGRGRRRRAAGAAADRAGALAGAARGGARRRARLSSLPREPLGARRDRWPAALRRGRTRRPGSTGRRWRAAPACSSGGWSASRARNRWSSSTPARREPLRRRSWLDAAVAPPPRSRSSSPAPAAAASCCRAPPADRGRTVTSPPGRAVHARLALVAGRSAPAGRPRAGAAGGLTILVAARPRRARLDARASARPRALVLVLPARAGRATGAADRASRCPAASATCSGARGARRAPQGGMSSGAQVAVLGARGRRPPAVRRRARARTPAADAARVRRARDLRDAALGDDARRASRPGGCSGSWRWRSRWRRSGSLRTPPAAACGPRRSWRSRSARWP